MNDNKVKVEVWTDIMCPFCYIGKKKFEEGLAQFAHKDKVEVVWKSFQLDPGLSNNDGLNLNAYIADRKSISIEEATALNEGVKKKAAAVGINYNYEKVIPSNTYKAHQLSHFARKHGVQSEAGDLLYRSHFVEGKKVDHVPTLLQLVEELGLSAEAFKTALDNQTFANDVKADISEAKELGIKMIPYFMVNRKYTISGSYDSQTFTEVLTKAYNEGQQAASSADMAFANGESCDVEGKCD